MKNLYDLLLIIKPNLGDDTYKKHVADIQSWISVSHEVEIKSSWDDEWPTSWRTVHIPSWPCYGN